MADENGFEEKAGRVAMGLAWAIFAIKFILTASVISLVVLFLIKKPLWLAPIIGVGLYLFYRIIIVGLIWTLIDRVATHQVKETGSVNYDPSRMIPIIRASICNGEKVAGFKDLGTGHFTEVMLIRSDADLAKFMETYGLEEVRTEY